MRYGTMIFVLGCSLAACSEDPEMAATGTGVPQATAGTPQATPGAAITPGAPGGMLPAGTATQPMGTAGTAVPAATTPATPTDMGGAVPMGTPPMGTVPMDATSPVAGMMAPEMVGMMDPATGGDDPCAGTDMGMAPADLHAAAAAVLTAAAPCGSSSCHGGSRARAGLELLEVPNLNEALVGKFACEAPNLPLIDGSGGAAALANSFLWYKITGAAEAGILPGDPATFGMAGACGQPGDQPYGELMPKGGGQMSEERLAPIRAWICAGAPAPL